MYTKYVCKYILNSMYIKISVTANAGYRCPKEIS